MAEPMTEAEARERLRLKMGSRCLDAILATTDALAVLLDPETMLRAWEKAGRAYWFTCDGIAWRIVPDEEGAT